jgi:hypothetical protein
MCAPEGLLIELGLHLCMASDTVHGAVAGVCASRAKLVLTLVGLVDVGFPLAICIGADVGQTQWAVVPSAGSGGTTYVIPLHGHKLKVVNCNFFHSWTSGDFSGDRHLVLTPALCAQSGLAVHHAQRVELGNSGVCTLFRFKIIKIHFQFFCRQRCTQMFHMIVIVVPFILSWTPAKERLTTRSEHMMTYVRSLTTEV